MNKEPWLRWQIIQRNSDYISFCNKIAKDSFDEKLMLKAQCYDEVALKTKEKHGLKNIYHYSKIFSPGECYENFDIFNHTAPVVRVFPEIIFNSINIEKLTDLLQENGEPQSHLVYDELETESNDTNRKLNIEKTLGFPSTKDFIYFGIRIDDDVKWVDIEPHIKRYINFARAISNIEQKDTRRHTAKHEDYLKIWDKRICKTPFTQIATELSITEDLAKKRFKAVLELIEGKSYDRVSWHDMIRDKLACSAKKNDDAFAWENVLKHEETYLREKIFDEHDSIDLVPDKNYALPDDLRIDITRLCENCNDVACRKAIAMEDYDRATPCPNFLNLIDEYRD